MKEDKKISSNIESNRVDYLNNDQLQVDKVEKSNTRVDSKIKEVGGPKGLEPTRYGDWESKGRCYDF